MTDLEDEESEKADRAKYWGFQLFMGGSVYFRMQALALSGPTFSIVCEKARRLLAEPFFAFCLASTWNF
ncbi:hypothetical protein CYMTET_32031 [Cymbomonas tetramitiformis]|uniref:Uncharacterized protein n=1 Tax=Cymbomonas tetramitiformis TaxID=36881 RepID=A0AAE0KS98_9CHLO|nr:hypothetical protein CYMTET_32031 [Cymbomonas tetramitiformis]